MAHLICGDNSKTDEYYVCGADQRCYQTDRAEAKFRVVYDTVTGDICSRVAVTCPC